MKSALAHLEKHRDGYLELLLEYLRIPSVSAQSRHEEDVRRAAAFMRERLEEAGFQTGTYEGDGLPTVHGTRTDDPTRQTLVVYGHYDVQPPEPLELWETPPFEPTLVNGEIRARGAADDKGPSLALVLAAECILKATGELPVSLRFVIEGEEEVGGEVVKSYLREHREDLKADALVVADTSGIDKGVPALCYGLRGMAVAEVEITGPSGDLHSGSYGGCVANPATELARLVATLHDEQGRVAIDEFYEGVAELDETERARLAALPFDEAKYLEETGSPALHGEQGYCTLERETARPTCEINGIFGGYLGEGMKTIVPSKAGCKISCRLVPGQDPETVQAALIRHLETRCPPTVTLRVTPGSLAPAMFTDPETKWARAARAAMAKAFDQEPALTRTGGSIPVMTVFQEVLGLQPLLLGTYTPGERAHSPNERYPVEDFFAAIRTGIHLFGNA